MRKEGGREGGWLGGGKGRMNVDEEMKISCRGVGEKGKEKK